MNSTELVEKARALLAAATPGPWVPGRADGRLHRHGCPALGDASKCHNVWSADDNRDVTAPCAGPSGTDADLIAFAVNNLPALLDALDARAKLALELRKEIKAQVLLFCATDEKLQAALAENAALKDAMIGLREFRARPGAAEAAFDGDGAKVLLAGLVHVMRSAPNYLETTFDLGGNADRFVLTIRRAGGRSPHELRVEAERQVEALHAEVERLKAARQPCKCVAVTYSFNPGRSVIAERVGYSITAGIGCPHCHGSGAVIVEGAT